MGAEKKIFFFLFASFPLIDVLNGFALSAGLAFPIGILYRAVSLVFLILAIFKHGFPKQIITILTAIAIFTGFLALLFHVFILENSYQTFMYDFMILIKFFMWILIPYYIYQCRNFYSLQDFKTLFLIISVLFAAGLLIPYFLGVGNQTYAGSNVGFKGFFFANNDTTVAFITAATFTGVCLVKERHTSIWGFLGWLLLYAGILVGLFILGTKTGIIYGILLSICLIFYMIFIRKLGSLPAKMTLFLVSISLAAAVIVYDKNLILQLFSGTLNRLGYFYQLYNGDLLRLITSSRSDFLNAAFSKFEEGGSLTLHLFGFGFNYREKNWLFGDLVEMDGFDILFSLGFLGLFCSLLVLVFYAVWAVRRKNLYSLLFFFTATLWLVCRTCNVFGTIFYALWISLWGTIF
ncbi:hypothetical protein MFLO_14237 [Listeria floridensis FSL S10-1187]|uniref:Uncharacterized protein n=1 Tax=Listeria floridensis FSL S10-1187 TaxID=1265817 RepID=A0ABN0RBV5_9LIST|nr:O-antigen ligase family protein [Listeria floridensis]EUJ26120.1 hypothetical protein MFLO_14237 [Listeria floridensis FSL S10-1187]